MAHPKLNITILDFYSGEPGIKIVDCAKALSLYNRRSYRSGYVYSIDYIEYIGTVNDTVTIAVLPTTYGILGAYRLGYEAWLEQRSEAIDETGIEPGKWSDFKPFYNEDHFQGAVGGWPELEPRGMDGALTLQPLDQTGAEWNRAELVHNDFAAATTTTIAIGMLGANNLPVFYGSLMNEYGVLRSPTLSPDPLVPGGASGSWITRTSEAAAAMSSAVINLVEDENDQPPYANQADVALAPTYVGNNESAPGGIMLDTSTAGTTGRSVNLNGGLVPLGLLAISTAGGAYHLRVHMTRGSYKGVAAKSMGSFR